MISAAARKQDFEQSGRFLPLEELGDLYFRRSGSGPVMLVALHGFGLDGTMFSDLAGRVNPDTHTLIAIDLPGHGKTKWIDKTLRPKLWAQAYNELLSAFQPASLHLLGFSYGGRVWAKLAAEGLLDSADALTLIAPDGFGGRYTAWIDGRLGHLLAPASRLGEHPRPWLWLARQLEKRKIISPFARQFVDWQLSDPVSRARLQLTLRSLRYFRLGSEDYRALNYWAEDREAEVWAGRRDQIIRLDRMRAILGRMDQVRFETYTGGHWLPGSLNP